MDELKENYADVERVSWREDEPYPFQPIEASDVDIR